METNQITPAQQSTITKEQIGSKILRVGFDQVGTTRIPRAYVWSFKSIADGKQYYFVVPQTGYRKYMGAQEAALRGKQGVDYFRHTTLAQVNKTVSKFLA